MMILSLKHTPAPTLKPTQAPTPARLLSLSEPLTRTAEATLAVALNGVAEKGVPRGLQTGIQAVTGAPTHD